MFNLEQSIAEWRQQMLAAGIKSPVPLEELESHLREEIEELIKSGLSDQQAFEATLLQIGQGQELQTEFAKERSWADLLRGNHIHKRAKRIFWVWIAMCVLVYAESAENRLTGPLLIISSAGIAIVPYILGVFWSLLLCNIQKSTCRIIQTIAICGIYLSLAFAILCLIRPSFIHFHAPLWMIPSYFCLFTIIFLAIRLPAEPKKATN